MSSVGGKALMRGSPLRYIQDGGLSDGIARNDIAIGPLQALAAKENDLLHGTGDWHNIQV